MRKACAVAAVIGVLLWGQCAWAENVRGGSTTSSSPVLQRTQPVVSGVRTQIIPKLVAKGRQLFLELDQNVKKVEVLSAGQKLGTLGSGNSFDVTQYLGKAVGNKLNFNILDASNNTLTKEFDISQWKNLAAEVALPQAQGLQRALTKGVSEVKKAELKPSADLISPNEGETWETGETYEISWSSVGIPAANCEGGLYFGCVGGGGGNLGSSISHGVWCVQFVQQLSVGSKPQGTFKFRVVDSSKLDPKIKQGDVFDMGLVLTLRNTATSEEYSSLRNIKLKIGPPKPTTISAAGVTGTKEVPAALMEEAPGQPKVSLQNVQGSIDFTDPAEDGVLWEPGKTYTVSWESMLVPNNATGKISFACGMGDPEQNPDFNPMECFTFARIIQDNAPISGSTQFTVPYYPSSNWGGQMKPPHGKPVVMFLMANFKADNNYYTAKRKVKVKALP